MTSKERKELKKEAARQHEVDLLAGTFGRSVRTPIALNHNYSHHYA